MEAINQYGAYKWSKDVLKDLTLSPILPGTRHGKEFTH